MTNHTDKLFLSREACTDLGIISQQFPTVNKAGETSFHNSISSATTATTATPQQECHCPKRTKPPPIPTSLPYPATEANRGKLQQYLPDYYSSSIFNTCEHQTLLLMEGPPMRLMIDPQATPTEMRDWVHLNPYQLANQSHGVIEWSYVPRRMAPRRTIDFQPLNTHATRETHHTVAIPPGTISSPR